MGSSTKAVTYLRVSGEGQISGDGFPRQREACQRYATTSGMEIVEEFRDEGVTGKMELEGRAGLSACIAYVRVHQVQTVLCESSDRIARDMIVAEVVIREFQKIGVRVVSASGIDLTEGDDANPTAKLIRQILAAVAEFDRCVTVLKLRGARQRKKIRTGKGEGRHAFGEKPGEKKILDQMVWDRKNVNSTFKQIAYDLNRQGVKTRSGKPWRGSVVAKILRRQTQ